MITPTQTTYEPVIGLEVHLQLNTNTKIFCGCQNVFGSDPNTNVCPVCLGLPGSLPVLNEKVLEYAVKVGLALDCQINNFVKFDRKNYFYPDCPKAYQISQFDYPIARNGFINILKEDGSIKKIRVHRAHIEEDAGKLMHEADGSLVDYNRTGTPLMEIVSEADLRSAQEAYDYLTNLKLVLQYLGVSDCDMEKGSLRCDANVSIRPVGQEKFGTKTELKNMNSFRAVKLGIDYEIMRQTQVLESGEKVLQETRLWNEEKGMTFLMRSKEEAHDYRYFPEPDLVPFTIDALYIDGIRKTLPELPEQKFERLVREHKISAYEARILVQDPAWALFFESCVKHYPDVKKVCNWISGPILQEINEHKISLLELNVTPEKLVGLIRQLDNGTISNLVAKDVLKQMIESGKTAEVIIREKGLAQVSDTSALEAIVDQVIAENQATVDQVKAGKESAIGFLVGQAMKKSQGKGNPKILNDIMKRRLSL